MPIKQITLIGLLAASLTVGKMALAFIMNVEIVTFLFILYTLTFGFKRSLLVALVFVTTEILLYGFGTWLLGYYLIWPTLIMVVTALKKMVKTEYGWAFVAGLFGLLFGAFFAVTEGFFYGVAYGFTYWVKGLPFDIIHGASNFIIMLTLFRPVKKPLERLTARYLQ